MFYSESHRKIFCSHGLTPAPQKHLEGIARGMSHRHHDKPRRYDVGFSAAGKNNTLRFAVLYYDVVHPRPEQNFSAGAFDITAHCDNYLFKVVAAYMRFGKIPYLLGRPEPHEYVRHFPIVTGVRLRVEFAVGKGPRSPFAELYITFGIENFVFRKGRRLLFSHFDIVAAFRHYRLYAAVQQPYGGKKSAWSAADDNDGRRRQFFLRHDGQRRGGREAGSRKILSNNPVYVAFVAGVQRFF